jgi:hypothetical protein
MSSIGRAAPPYSSHREGRTVVTLQHHSGPVLVVFCGQFLASVEVAFQLVVD